MSPSSDRPDSSQAEGVPGVAPTEIGEEVQADLDAAFARDATRLRIKDDPTVAQTAPITFDETREVGDAAALSTGASIGVGSDAPSVRGRLRSGRRRRRRSILEIARDYDSRIKAQNEAKSGVARVDRIAETSEHVPDHVLEQPGEAVPEIVARVSETSESDESEAPEVGAKGKQRVVITDDTVDVARTAGERRRAPRRRLAFRVRSAEDDELSRLRKQRRAKQRSEGRWRPRWYTVAGSIALLVVFSLLILTSPILSIKRVEIEGNVYADPGVLADIVADLEGDPILTADLHGAEVRVEAIPWVRKARISMHLPTKVLIQVDERVPLAFVRSTDGFNRVIDRDGRVLDVIEGDPIDYTRIIGSAPTLVAGDFVPQPFLGAAQLINALPGDLAERLVSATVSPEGEISLQFTPNLQVIFGAPADYQAKLVGIINEIKRQGTRSYTVIDVSTGEPNVR